MLFQYCCSILLPVIIVHGKYQASGACVFFRVQQNKTFSEQVHI